jgi:hypothetical protein
LECDQLAKHWESLCRRAGDVWLSEANHGKIFPKSLWEPSFYSYQLDRF